MPLIKRAISPVAVSRGCIPQNVTKDELQCIANGTLANLIRQLSSLSRHAEHIVGDIYHEAMKLDHKSNLLQQRIERLASKVEQLDSNNEQASLEQLHMRKAFKSNMLIDQRTLDRDNLPPALIEVYSKCDPPPNLNALNPYRDDPNDALSLYTNPGFFFDLWRKEMLKDVGDTRRKMKSPEGQKSPKKKRRAEQQNNQNIPRTNVHNRYVSSSRMAPMGALSFPEEYQAPQSLGLQLHRNVGYQPVQSSAPVIPPPGMSVRAPPMLIERNDVRSSVSPPKEIVKRDLPLPDMSILDIDDDEELPPPPVTLMQSSIVQHMPSPPQTQIQFVPNEGQQVIAPPPPPPPPPPPNFFSQPAGQATFTAAPRPTEASTAAARAAPPITDARNDLLAQIRAGFDLRKTRRAEEESQDVANDVAAILRRRMEQVRPVHEDEDSQGSDDNEWDD